MWSYVSIFKHNFAVLARVTRLSLNAIIAYRNISDKHAEIADAYIIKPDTRRIKEYGSYHREKNFKDEI